MLQFFYSHIFLLSLIAYSGDATVELPSLVLASAGKHYRQQEIASVSNLLPGTTGLLLPIAS